MIDLDRLSSATALVRRRLWQARDQQHGWTGHLASSPLATATAVSALVLAAGGEEASRAEGGLQAGLAPADEALVRRGLEYLVARQNPDGGWGDTQYSHSNVATTMLALAAFRLTGVPGNRPQVVQQAQEYLQRRGWIDAVRARYGKDKTFAVPILTNAALAGLVPWREVSALPFEAAWMPQSWYRFLRLPVVSYAVPALVAMGQVKFRHDPPWNPLLRLLRRAAREPTLRVLERMQPASGGFLEATPLTSFVVMSLASCGLRRHPVVRRGVEFLRRSARPDGSWPIDTNLATWNTTLALNAWLPGAEEEALLLRLTGASRRGVQQELGPILAWLLECQHREVHPYTGSPPGGWAWTDLSGGVPDADDTAGALLALGRLRLGDWITPERQAAVDEAARAGVVWLLDLQNRDGGWPTFCRGWGTLPFDRSACDLTAHALRAFALWQKHWSGEPARATLCRRMEQATRRGLAYLARTQRNDGSWVPLWFGNQHHPEEENPVYGTARVLLAYAALGRHDAPEAQHGAEWLKRHQNADGGWGSRGLGEHFGAQPQPAWPGEPLSSVEETALAVEALAALASCGGEPSSALERGIDWLLDAVEQDRWQQVSPIGFYFAKLWYYERMYPITFTAAALSRACAAFCKLHPSQATLT